MVPAGMPPASTARTLRPRSLPPQHALDPAARAWLDDGRRPGRRPARPPSAPCSPPSADAAGAPAAGRHWTVDEAARAVLLDRAAAARRRPLADETGGPLPPRRPRRTAGRPAGPAPVRRPRGATRPDPSAISPCHSSATPCAATTPALIEAALGPYAAARLPDARVAAGRPEVRLPEIPLDRVAGLDRPRRRRTRPDARRLRRRTHRRRPPRTRGPHPPRAPRPHRGHHSPSGTRAARPPIHEPSDMRIFDPHIHMTSRTTDDYEAMYAAGVRAVVEPAFWLGQPRTSPASFFDYFDSLLGWEPFRAAQYGIAAPLHDRPQPQGGQRPALPPRPRRAAPLPRQGPGRRRRRDRLRLHDPGRGRRPSPPSSSSPPTTACPPSSTPRTATSPPGLRRTLDVVRESGLAPERVLLDHLNETDRRAGPRQRLLGRASPSTRRPR